MYKYSKDLAILLHIRQSGNTNTAPQLIHQNWGTSLQGGTGGKDIT